MGIGGMEMMVILIVALMVIGPKKLVDVARTAGHFIREFRAAVSEGKEVVDQVTEEVEGVVTEVKREFKEQA